MLVLWIILLVVSLLGEAATAALISIWFAAGSVAAIIASVAGAPVLVQWIIFIGVSAVLLAFTRPLLKKLMPNKYIPTNGELDIGKKAVVIETIDGEAGTGRVRIDGVDWRAVSENGVIPEGTTVIVKNKESATVTVEAEKINA
ncbi:MAG: NfeD family protein [Huintestinicola sp.]